MAPFFSWLRFAGYSFLGGIFFCVSSNTVNAKTIEWIVPSFSVYLTSSGLGFDDTFVFELGAFTNGFTPNSANKADWAANWHPVHRSFFEVVVSGTSGAVDFTSNGAPFQTTSRAYIWGHNSSITNGEWVLITDPTWMWPDVAPGAPNSGFNVVWGTTLAAEVIVGELRGAGFHIKTAASSGALPLISSSEWRTMRFTPSDLANPLIGGWQADPDLDGMSNQWEYILGKNPTSALSYYSVVPTATQVGMSSYFSISVPKCGYSAASLLVEVSSDLMTWQSTAPNITLMTGTPDFLSVRSSTPIGGLVKQFIRLKASFP